MNIQSIKTEKRVNRVELLPPEGLEKFNNFCNIFKVYFKNQVVAGNTLKVGQATVNRYLSGQLLVPLKVAKKINELSMGVVEINEIYFDYKAYSYDEKIKQKQSGLSNT